MKINNIYIKNISAYRESIIEYGDGEDSYRGDMVHDSVVDKFKTLVLNCEVEDQLRTVGLASKARGVGVISLLFQSDKYTEKRLSLYLNPHSYEECFYYFILDGFKHHIKLDESNVRELRRIVKGFIEK